MNKDLLRKHIADYLAKRNGALFALVEVGGKASRARG